MSDDEYITRREFNDGLSGITLGLTQYMDERFGRVDAALVRIETTLARIERDLRPGRNGDKS